ncbi:P33 [Plodia interpunctella granulovirus]|uniref:p33 n=1 Tax=Plodia interpunctella granulovirus TaxID=262175 RepID=A0A1L5JGN8_9BBAC|nr:P33 [Plodia interpunctella granulovirus]APO13964.1 P33 [Plodia interpunctella granulovirus]
MFVETLTIGRYKNSFALFVYRLLDMTRMAPSPELKTVLVKEVKFLYSLICLIMYDDNKSDKMEDLIEWASNLDSDIKLAEFQEKYVEKLKSLDLDNLEPQKYSFSFGTIWDSIHFMCLIADDIIHNRDSYEYEHVSSCIKNLKWVFYNIFIVLFCPVCARHYLTVDSFPYELERVEVALYREKMGEPLVLTQEINRNQGHKNVLFKHHLTYKSMLFHNHVNNYRPIQHKKDELNKFQRMEWTLYKTLLGI